MATGFELDTGYEGLNTLLNRGGMASMPEVGGKHATCLAR